MVHFVEREKDLEVDLESGGTSSEEDRTKDLGSANKLMKKNSKVWNGVLSFDGSVNPSKFGDIVDGNVELLVDNKSEGEEGQEHMPFAENKWGEEKHKKKKKNSRKAPKPPRPPKGPLLDAADQKLVQEFAELAMRKRARIERIKALKKTKATKASCFNNSISAMVITVLFCLVIIFQVICSGSSPSMTLQGSPEPAVAGESLISLQFYGNFTGDESNGPGSGSLNLAKDGHSSTGLRKK